MQIVLADLADSIRQSNEAKRHYLNKLTYYNGLRTTAGWPPDFP